MGPEAMGLKVPLQVTCQENPAVWKARNGHRVFEKVTAALSLVGFKIAAGKGLLGMAQVELILPGTEVAHWCYSQPQIL